jgi:hypothetical protein
MKYFSILFLFLIGCESGISYSETLSEDESCRLCKEINCQSEVVACEKSELCGRFDACILEKNYSCDQCFADVDLQDGFSIWKSLAQCDYTNCSDVCFNDKVLECSK